VEEALGDGVDETATGPSGAEDEAGPPGQLLDPQGEKWPAAIGVEQESRRRPPLRQGHGQRLGRKPLVQERRHGPADEAAGVEIEHDGQVEPALAGAHRGDVGDPAPIRGAEKSRRRRSGAAGSSAWAVAVQRKRRSVQAMIPRTA
jgi:hypothetical protein